MAQIGKAKSKPFDDLREIVNEIEVAARTLARLWARDHFRTDEQWEKHRAQVEKYEAVFWEGIAGDDTINPQMKRVIEEIEATCSEIIAGRAKPHGFLNLKLGGRN